MTEDNDTDDERNYDTVKKDEEEDGNLMMKATRVELAQRVVLWNLQEKASIQSSWLLLDSQSSNDVFWNGKMLTNIKDVKSNLVMHCNAGNSVTKEGDWGSMVLYGIILKC